MDKRKLRFSVNVPILAVVRFTTMATSMEEAKADVCMRLAEKEVQPEMFAYWERNDEPEYEVQWDSISVWLDAGYMANAERRAELTEEEWKEHSEQILYPPGDPNLNTDMAKQIAMMLNDTIMSSNEYLLTIAKKIANQDFAWLAAFSAQTIEDANKPDWNTPKNRTME